MIAKATMRTFTLSLVPLFFSWREASSFCLHHPASSSRSSSKRTLSSSSSLLSSPWSSSSSWSATDDWNELSRENPRNGIQSEDVFNQVLADKAAREMMMMQSNQNGKKSKKTEEQDAWFQATVDTIYHQEKESVLVVPEEEEGVEEDLQRQQRANEELMGEEISLLIRCNEDPTQLLIQSGRALPPLTELERNDISQLLLLYDGDVNNVLLQPTPFLQQAVETMFAKYAFPATAIIDSTSTTNRAGDDVEEEETKATTNKTTKKEKAKSIMSRVEVAKWLSVCGTEPVGPHDGRVQAILSQYADYGTAVLTQEGMLRLYVTALVGTRTASPTQAMSLNKLQQFRSREVQEVWRDIRNHGILSPVEAERQELIQQLEHKQGPETAAKGGGTMDMLMDECEIVDDFGTSSSATSVVTNSKSSRNRRGGANGPKSSHEVVELADDGKTPLYIKDGDFVFIDEASCIGCTQCVLAAPSSFLMTEYDGRARTFSQRKSPDVAAAVSTCPVSCMHYVSFRELKELELARDRGDGRKDHGHFGFSEDRGHYIPLTPLHVSGRASDSNHKSSWYHYLRNQCYKSKQCPQRGCFDCPMYQSNPTSNPYFQKRLQEANHVRAKHFIDHGMADSFRKTAEL